jgi:protein involved in polysaccharide export with SLBB domain
MDMLVRAGRFLLLIAASTVIAGGAAAQSVAGQASSAASVDTSQDYKLGVSDKIRVTVYNEPNLTGEYPISPSGNVSLPLIGEIAANGRTVAAVRQEVQERFADGYLRDPKVTIDIVTFRPFYILGEITHPGELPYSDGMTVLNAVATAQGFTYRANKKYVFIKHKGEATEARIPLTPDLRVLPGDTVRIGERYF